MERNLVLEVRLSAFVTAAVDESAPLSRRGVIELLQDYLSQRAVDWELLIDHVRIEEVRDEKDEVVAGAPQTALMELMEAGLIENNAAGLWA